MSGSLFGRPARTRLRRVLLTSTLAAAAGAFVVDPAAAADTDAAVPPIQMQAFDPADFDYQAAQLPAGLVDAVQRDLGIEPDEYLARAAAAKVAGEVLEYLGDTARSAWLDAQELHVAVDDQADAAIARATGAEVHVGDALTDALAAARAQNKVAYIDREADKVVPVDVDLNGEPVSKLRLLPQSDWRGGYGFAISDVLADYHCSTGFNGTDADGRPRVLTAGHCGSGDDGLLTSAVHHLDPPAPIRGDGDLADTWPEYISGELGEFAPGSFVFGGGGDAGLIDITNDDWDVLPEVAAWNVGGAAAEDARQLRVYDSIDAVAGAPACSSGATSGWTCGQLLDPQTTVPVSGRDVTGFIFDACVLPGDSGGAVVVGNYALGVNSGSTWRGPTCTETDGADISLGYAVSSGDDNAESLYGNQWQLLIHVGAPVVASPADATTVAPRPTFSGVAAAAAGATVSLSIEDGPTLETTVDPTGRWKVAITDPLAPGTHTYAVTASHTTETGGTTTTSETTTGSFDIADVAGLTVSRPQPGDTPASAGLTFEGTGHPGATVTLSVDDQKLGSSVVGNDGSWSITPDDGLEAGRFDALISQQVGRSSNSVTVSGIGIGPVPPVITSPRPGAAVSPDHTFTGVGIAGATISVRVSGADERGELPAPDSTTALRVQADARGIWEIELDEPLEAGVQRVVATQAVDDLTSEPSASVPFEVVARQARDSGAIGGGDDDLAITGASTNLLLVVAAFLLAIGAGFAAAGMRRRVGD